MAGASGATGWVVALAVILQAGLPSSGDADLPIDGDPKLLLMMRDAQHANADRYPFGEAEVIAEIGRPGGPPHRRVEALVRWDGDKQRLTCVFTDRGTPPGESEPRLFKSRCDLIYRDNRSVLYDPDHRKMTISPISKLGHYDLTQLRPQDWWYGKVKGEGTTWADEMDQMLRRPPEFLRQVRVRRLGGEQVEVVRDSGAAGRYRLVSSLVDDGNPVLFEMDVLESDFDEKRSYVWSRDERGRCYLKSCRVDRRTGKGGIWLHYEVVRFDADKRPPQSAFEDRAIQIAPGTVVDDQIAGRRRRIGDRPVEETSASLDRLVPELKSRGFAAPARSQ
jgi:hypothetical protein